MNVPSSAHSMRALIEAITTPPSLCYGGRDSGDAKAFGRAIIKRNRHRMGARSNDDTTAQPECGILPTNKRGGTWWFGKACLDRRAGQCAPFLALQRDCCTARLVP
jgi:hypothetical protein